MRKAVHTALSEIVMIDLLFFANILRQAMIQNIEPTLSISLGLVY